MTKIIGGTAVAALVGLTAVAPAAAAPRDNNWWMWQQNHQHMHYRHYHPGYYGRGYYGNGYYPGYYDPGYDATAGFIGGIFGTIAGAAIANSGSGSSHVWRCEHTYRSYRPATNTYTGYDGKTYVCRL